MKSYWSRGAWSAALPLCIALLPAGALAQEAGTPTGPIEITVASSAGSTPDVLMRQMAEILNSQGIVENPIVIVNRPGGAWSVGMNYVLERSGDPNTLMAFAEPVISTPIVQGVEPTYDDLTPLGMFVQTQLIVVAQPDHKANNLAELVEIARADPGAVLVSGANAGSTDDQVRGLIEQAADVKLTYVPHDGGGAAAATFLGGNTDILTATIDEALPMIEAGTAKPLAILNKERRTEEALKDIPTAVEQGINVVWGQYFGLMGPGGLDPATVAWWDDKLGKLVETAEWKALAQSRYLGTDYMDSAETAKFLPTMHESRLEILTAIGATP
jgi:putative tricarboxylic transport membrane protein